ncbi:MAG: YIP1 family protein [Prolixibacteraceae bacterium]|nr:YIP1 family protein [Prolixibacteraceae bacterium]
MNSISDITNKIGEIIFTPNNFWKLQKEKTENLPVLLGSYFFPLLSVIVLVVFLGEVLRSADFYVGFALLKAIRKFLLFTIALFVTVYFANTLITTFGGKKNIKKTRQLLTYSFTPFLLVSIVTGMFPFLYPVDVLGIYSLYIFWVGGKELLDLPEQNRNNYLLLTTVVIFLIISILSILLSKLLTAYF